MYCYYNSGFIKTAGRNQFFKIKILLKDWNKNMTNDDLFKNIFWTIYKELFTMERGNVSSQKFFFLNVEHSVSYIILSKITLKILL